MVYKANVSMYSESTFLSIPEGGGGRNKQNKTKKLKNIFGCVIQSSRNRSAKSFRNFTLIFKYRILIRTKKISIEKAKQRNI